MCPWRNTSNLVCYLMSHWDYISCMYVCMIRTVCTVCMHNVHTESADSWCLAVCCDSTILHQDWVGSVGYMLHIISVW
jgi:hypothetical protein